MALRVGLIGCGIISSHHLASWAQLGNRPDDKQSARIVAATDLDPAKAQQAAEAAGGATVYPDYQSLLADPSIDAVDICLPHHLHRPVTEAAFAAGKHVLCEKPIATTLADADAMIAASQAANRVLTISEQSRYNDAVDRTREVMAGGELGRVYVMQSAMAWWQGGEYMGTPWRFDTAKMGGGSLIDGGMHVIDYVTHLLGRPLTMTAQTSRIRECSGAEDTAAVIARYPDDLLAVVTVMSSCQRSLHNPFTLFGTDGILSWRHPGLHIESIHLPDHSRDIALDHRHWFSGPIEDFVDCIAEGREPKMSGAAARLDLEFVLTAYELARSGATVTLPTL